MKGSQYLIRAAENAVASRPGQYARSVATKFGLERALIAVHDQTLAPLFPTEQPLTVDDITLAFLIRGPDEYRTFNQYPEQEPSYPVLPDIADRLRPDDVFWDIGANVGIYTCFGAATVESGQVISIEPNPDNVARIEENLARNGLAATTHQCGLMDTPGEFTLNVHDPDTAGSYGHLTDGPDVGVAVDVHTGDGLVARGTPAPTAVKIDVQGVEFEVLRGMERTLARDECRVIYYNVNERSERRSELDLDIHDWLRDRGFEIETIWEWTLGEYRGAYRRAERR